MKDLIVLLASIILGLYIFGLVAGDEGSVKEALKESWTGPDFSRQYVEMDRER